MLTCLLIYTHAQILKKTAESESTQLGPCFKKDKIIAFLTEPISKMFGQNVKEGDPIPKASDVFGPEAECDDAELKVSTHSTYLHTHTHTHTRVRIPKEKGRQREECVLLPWWHADKSR